MPVSARAQSASGVTILIAPVTLRLDNTLPDHAALLIERTLCFKAWGDHDRADLIGQRMRIVAIMAHTAAAVKQQKQRCRGCYRFGRYVKIVHRLPAEFDSSLTATFQDGLSLMRCGGQRKADAQRANWTSVRLGSIGKPRCH